MTPLHLRRAKDHLQNVALLNKDLPLNATTRLVTAELALALDRVIEQVEEMGKS